MARHLMTISVLVIVAALAAIAGVSSARSRTTCTHLAGSACSATCQCYGGLICKQSVLGLPGKCVECAPDELYNCYSGQVCSSDGLCTWESCLPPKHIGDVCTDKCPCPGNLICAPQANGGNVCVECTPKIMVNCLNTQTCSADGQCVFQACGNPPTDYGQYCSTLCKCPAGKGKCIEGRCLQCGRGAPCPKGYFCFNGKCYRSLVLSKASLG